MLNKVRYAVAFLLYLNYDLIIASHYHPDCDIENHSTTIQYFAHPTNCTKFFQCKNGVAEENSCPPKLKWNQKYNICDGTNDCQINANVCQENEHRAVENNCQQYNQCENGVWSMRTCLDGYLWQQEQQHCVVSSLAKCHLNKGGMEVVNGAVDEACLLQDNSSEPIYFPYASNCINFYKCVNGRSWLFTCPSGLLWSIKLQRCEHAYLVHCKNNETVKEINHNSQVRVSNGMTESIATLILSNKQLQSKGRQNEDQQGGSQTSKGRQSSRSKKITNCLPSNKNKTNQNTNNTGVQNNITIDQNLTISSIDENQTIILKNPNSIDGIILNDTFIANIIQSQLQISTKKPTTNDANTITSMLLSNDNNKVESTANEENTIHFKSLSTKKPTTDVANISTSIILSNDNIDNIEVEDTPIDASEVPTKDMLKPTSIEEQSYAFNTSVFSNDRVTNAIPKDNTIDNIAVNSSLLIEKANQSTSTSKDLQTIYLDTNSIIMSEDVNETNSIIMSDLSTISIFTNENAYSANTNVVNQTLSTTILSPINHKVITPNANDLEPNETDSSSKSDSKATTESLLTNSSNEFKLTTLNHIKHQDFTDIENEMLPTITSKSTTQSNDALQTSKVINYNNLSMILVTTTASGNFSDTLITNNDSSTSHQSTVTTLTTDQVHETTSSNDSINENITPDQSNIVPFTVVVVDPRLPFLAPQCQGSGNRIKFSANNCLQYYQCFESYAYLLNCHHGKAFDKISTKCVEKRLTNCEDSL